MLPKYYEFQHGSKILSGLFALENLPLELRNMGLKAPLLLSDRGLEKSGALGLVLSIFKENSMEIGCMDIDIPADSSLECVNKIAEEYKLYECDCIVAVGGGSVIDTAKGVRMVLSQDGNDIEALAGCEALSRGRAVPFAAVPTTSGTGSEATIVAVIRNNVTNVKMEYISYYLQPDIAVIDVRMTETLPPKLTASTGMDALCHAIEAYTCLQKNPVSDAYAAAAIKMISENLVKATKNGGDKQARLAMANGSMMAGAAFSNSMVGIVHAIGHALGGVCHVPHAVAMSILLPYGMEYNYKKCGDLYGELLLYLAGADEYASTPAEERGKKAIAYVKKLLKKLNSLTGLPLKLSDAGVTREDFDTVAQAAINDGAIIVNPRAAGIEEVKSIMEKAF